jgi:hypothetical protein
MNLADQRQAIRPLLNEQDPADAAEIFYAFHHPKEKINLFTYPKGSASSTGYICSGMTGIDLFRPLVTLRLPLVSTGRKIDFDEGLKLIYSALPIGAEIIISAPSNYYALLSAIIDIHREETLPLLVLDKSLNKPMINVLVTRAESHDSLPRYIIRRTDKTSGGKLGDIVASAGVNWQTPRFTDIYVHTNNKFRRMGMGKSVVTYLVKDILDSGRTPLYSVATENNPSYELARSVGFVDSGMTEKFIEGRLKKPPGNSI